MRPVRSWAALASVGLAVSAATVATTGVPAAASSSARSMLSGSLTPSVERSKPLGRVASASQVSFDLVLNLRDAAGAQANVKAVSDPGSASYRHYLTDAQWIERYAPTQASVASAETWLRQAGFRVSGVSKDRVTVSASGTAAQVETAFGAGLAYYKVNGQSVRLATSEMSVPASISGIVVGALGINQNVATAAVSGAGAAATQSSAPATSRFPSAPSAFVTAPPCGSYYGAKTATVTPSFGHGYPSTVPDEVCGYVPSQLRSAYNIGSATGKGVTVAIIDAYGSATIAKDATEYFKTNDPTNPFSTAHFSQRDAFPFDDESLCSASSWLVEQALDVEAVHAVARDAHILYVGAQDCVNGLFNAEQNVIDNRLADVVTNSWGDTGGDLLDDIATRTAYDDLFMLADSTGMTVLFSTGDDGDNFNLLGVSAADYPASSPYLTAMGGTSLQIGANGQQTGVLGWATGRSFECTANFVAAGVCSSSELNTWLPVSFDGGSGGFTSYNYVEPSYQVPVVPSSLALRNEYIIGPTPTRVVPDISMDADPSTGYLIGLHEEFMNGTTGYGEPRYGGTSLASPLMAGVIADVDGVAGADVGFINPAVYALDAQHGAIDDVLPGGKQAELRTDHAYTYLGPGSTGFLISFRELTYEGTITYCDATGNCASRPNTLSTAKGYDSMTGLGSIGRDFIKDLAAS